MGKTPRTDAESYDDPTPGYEVVSADFARTLELELAKLQRKHDKLCKTVLEAKQPLYLNGVDNYRFAYAVRLAKRNKKGNKKP